MLSTLWYAVVMKVLSNAEAIQRLLSCIRSPSQGNTNGAEYLSEEIVNPSTHHVTRERRNLCNTEQIKPL